MKTMTIIRFKPKEKYFECFLQDLKSGDSPCYVIRRDEEIVQIWLNENIDELTDFQSDALTWLDDRRYMLQEFSKEQGHTIAVTGFIEKEPTDGVMMNFKPSLD